MCGIAGVWGRECPDRELDAAAARLAHRGPDGTGRLRSTAQAGVPWGLVHTRLAINDLSAAGDQPMSDPTGRFHMVFNGEIYNYPELAQRCRALGRHPRSRMDGEVILHLYAEYGDACFAMLNGIFAVALVDDHAGALVLARDPLGVKPLLYRAEPDRVAFASEAAALGDLGVDLSRPGVRGLAMFLTFMWIPAPETPFAGVRSLEPGELLRCDGRSSTTRRFGDRLLPTGDHEGRAARPGEFAEVFEAACRRQLLSDVPVGAMASGGIDSGLVLAATGPRLRSAYTIAWGSAEHHGAGGWDAERDRTRTIAERSQVALHELAGARIDLRELPATGDLLSDPSAALTRAIARQARADGVVVLLAGHGGDELFGGYRRHAAARVIELARGPVPALARLAAGTVARARPGEAIRAEYLRRMARALAAGDQFTAYMGLCTYSDAARRAAILGCDEAEVSDEVVWSRHREVFSLMPSSVSLARRAMALDLALYLPGQGLAYADRAGMAEGVEVRVPWLDLDLVRWSLEQPTSSLLTLRRGKIPARRRAGEVLGATVAGAPKMGFGAPHAFVGDQLGGHSTRQDDHLRSAIALLRTHAATWSPGADLGAPRSAVS